MGLTAPGVGIHGTPDPASLGYSASHGCIRMYIPQAEWLFDHVDVGTAVYIVPA
jgi:lipoprotein-anchoring transpeptidase ErfK/SrfK